MQVNCQVADAHYSMLIFNARATETFVDANLHPPDPAPYCGPPQASAYYALSAYGVRLAELPRDIAKHSIGIR
jgi:hypothetical protein